MIPPRHRSASLGILWAAALGLASLLCYVKTLAPTLLMADPAEFQLACYTLGIAHPTGYPLYLMLGWLWSHLLPVGDAAYRINLLSAAFAASCTGLFCVLSLGILRRTRHDAPGALLRAEAAICTLTLALSRTFWSQALTAEVYALNSLFVVTLLFLLLRWSESRSSRALRIAAVVYGLSLTHHSTMILFLPACVLFVWLTDRDVFRNARSLLVLALLIVAPLTLYLYIPWRAPATPYLHVELAPDSTLELYDNTPRGFLGFLTGEMFLGELGVQAPLLERLSMAGELLLRQFGIPGAALGLLGLVNLILGGKGSPARRLLALLALSYVTIVGFTLVYNVGDIHVFYTPSYIIFAVWIGVGMAWMVELVRGVRWPAFSAARPAAWALVALFALLPLALLWNNYRSVDKSDDYQARACAEGILWQPIPEGAILVSNDRNEITPLLYLQYVEGKRPDLLTMFPMMLPGEGYSNVVRVIDGLLDVRRPIYLVKPMPGLEIKYEMESLGPLVEVKGPIVTGAPQQATGTMLDNSLTLVGYDLDPNEPVPGGELQVSLYWRVEQDLSQDYHTYVHLLNEEGQSIAQSDHRPGQEYYPSSLWKPGETLLDVHVLSVPSETQTGVVTLQAGAYEYPSLAPLGSALTLSDLRIFR
jgi:hypothetical protein